MAIQPGWGESWETLANAINDYYGGGASSVQYQQVTNMLNSGNYTVDEMESIIGSIPDFQRTYNSSGQLTSVSYKAQATTTTTAGNIAQSVNSNAANATGSNFSPVQTIVKDPQTGTATITDTLPAKQAGAATTTKAVIGSTLAGVLAAGVGIQTGRNISQLAYDSGFNYTKILGFDVNIEDLNPERWASITSGGSSSGLEAAGNALFNILFQIDSTDKDPTPYIDENAFAYMLAYLGAAGALTDGYENWDGTKPQTFELYENIHAQTGLSALSSTASGYWCGSYLSSQNQLRSGGFLEVPNGDVVYTSGSDNQALYSIITSKEPLPSSLPIRLYDADGLPQAGGVVTPQSYTFDGRTVYYGYSLIGGINVNGSNATNYLNFQNPEQLAWILQYGTYVPVGIPGISSQPFAKQFDTTGITDWSDIDAVLQALKDQYPELWDNQIQTSTDGENVTTYIPIVFPTGGTGDKPTTEGAQQGKPKAEISSQGTNATDELIKTIIETIQDPLNKPKPGMSSDTNNPTQPATDTTDTGSGTTPVIVIPTGSAKALYSIYNPTQSQLNSFGAWLWSSNFVDQLLKIFNDPMQAIIGLHKIFATPPTSGTGNITVGYLDSGVSSKLVSAQYTTVDCGTISLKEYFRNALDYTDTDVYIYLPFIGIVPLNVSDVMRADINVKYRVDVLTGACLAQIMVNRDMGSGGQLYVYSGNCAVQYPLSSGSYMGIVSSVLGIAASAATTVLSGGAALPLALGASASAINNMKTHISHSGSISGNSGAMGIKKPYLIIRRPQTKIAVGYETFAGSTNNENVSLGSCSGFTRVKHCILDGLSATGEERNMINSMLKDGVII